MTTKPLLTVLRGDRGSVAAAMIFGAIALVLVGAAMTATITMGSFIGTVTRSSMINTAVDLRYDQYVEAIRGGATTDNADSTELCYATENTCVTIENPSTSGSTITITLHAEYGVGLSTSDVTRSFPTNTGGLITGFDSQNNPVWGS